MKEKLKLNKNNNEKTLNDIETKKSISSSTKIPYEEQQKELAELWNKGIQDGIEECIKIIKFVESASPEELEEYSKRITPEIEKHNQEVEQLQKKIDKFDKEYDINNQAHKLEKTNIHASIELYEQNIKNKTTIPCTYNRLTILYRKIKDYDNELRICEEAINNNIDKEYFTKRLNRVKIIKEKNRIIANNKSV